MPGAQVAKPFLDAAWILQAGEAMGLFDYFKKAEKDVMCPECEKHQKHVKLVKADGKMLECPECHYSHLARR